MPQGASHAPPDLLRVGWMEWRDLVFLHWPVEPERLASHVPSGLSLDLFEGRAWLSIVAFRMTLAPVLTPRLFALETPEINVRTYVRHESGMRGVHFLSLDVHSWAATLGARVGLGLPYYGASCHHSKLGPLVSFESERSLSSQGHFEVTFEPAREGTPAEDGTLSHFLTSRYALYADRPGTLWRVQIHHRPFELRVARIARLSHDLFRAAGLDLAEGAAPALAEYSPGVDVDVFRPEFAGLRFPSIPGYDRGVRERSGA